MSLYQNYCREVTDENGALLEFELSYPDNFNFAYDVVDRIATATPEKRALVWCNVSGEEHIFTFSDVKCAGNRMANVFKSAGIARGDRVMLILKRNYEYWFAAVALHKLGAVMIPATHMLTVSDLVYRLRASNAKAIVCTTRDGVPDKVREAVKLTDHPIRCWCVRGEEEGFENLSESMKTAGEHFERMETLVTDPMVLYFTSGTTGDPKGVIHDFSYPLAHIITAKYWQQAEEDGLHFTVAESGWAKASWGKIYGQWLVGCAVMVYDFDNFEPKQLVQIMNRFGVTSFCAPPTVFRYLVRKGIPELTTLRHASTAGEMLAPEVFRRFTERTGIPLCEGYGQTETTLLLANFKGREPTAGSLGRPSPFYRIELRDEEDRPVRDGEIGEIVVVPEEAQRKTGVFTSYLDDPEHYQYVWRDGVYHTGDAAWRDESGQYWFHGRFDDIIKTGGFRVGPCEIEHVLLEHPDVAECCVIGVPDPLRGQAIKAVVVPAAGIEPTRELERSIREFSGLRLAEYKWVRIIEFVDFLPRTISGKVRKNLLRNKG